MGLGFTTQHVIEQLVLPMGTATVTVLTHRLTRHYGVKREDLAVGLDLIVGAVFALSLFAVDRALRFQMSWSDWRDTDRWPVLATLALLVLSGIIVRVWGWSGQTKTDLRLLQGVIVPAIGSVLALLLVVTKAPM